MESGRRGDGRVRPAVISRTLGGTDGRNDAVWAGKRLSEEVRGLVGNGEDGERYK
jgi:hypothetical protein